MSQIPRIEVHHPWQDVPDCMVDASSPPPPSYIPPESTSQSKQLRPTFLSRLRRSKSTDGCSLSHPSPARPVPQPASTGASLVWSPEQQIWLFPREQDAAARTSSTTSSPFVSHRHNLSAPSENYNTGNSRRRTSIGRKIEKRRPASATLPRESSKSSQGPDMCDEALFTQLPGHYSLGVYDYAGHGSLQQSSETFHVAEADPRPPRNRAEDPWLSVARRLGAPGGTG